MRGKERKERREKDREGLLQYTHLCSQRERIENGKEGKEDEAFLIASCECPSSVSGGFIIFSFLSHEEHGEEKWREAERKGERQRERERKQQQ